MQKSERLKVSALFPKQPTLGEEQTTVVNDFSSLEISQKVSALSYVLFFLWLPLSHVHIHKIGMTAVPATQLLGYIPRCWVCHTHVLSSAQWPWERMSPPEITRLIGGGVGISAWVRCVCLFVLCRTSPPLTSYAWWWEDGLKRMKSTWWTSR